MKVLIRKLWEEPVVAGAVLLALVQAAGEALIGDGLTGSDLPLILAPLPTAFGVRAFTRPDERPVADPDPLATRRRVDDSPELH